MKKRICLFLIIASLFLTACSLFACGDSENIPGNTDKTAGNTSPSDSVDNSPINPAATDFETLCSTIDSVVTGFEEYVPRDEGYIENIMLMSPSSFASCRILVTTSGGSIDEYGVFEVLPGENVSDIDNAVKKYFAYYNEIWDDRYLPEEYPKLRDAKVKTYGGRFAVYAILDEAGRNAVFGAAESLFQ